MLKSRKSKIRSSAEVYPIQLFVPQQVVQYGEWAKFTPDDVAQLDDEIIDRLIEFKFAPELLQALWNRSKPPLP